MVKIWMLQQHSRMAGGASASAGKSEGLQRRGCFLFAWEGRRSTHMYSLGGERPCG